MPIKIKIYGTLRKLLQTDELTLSLKNKTLEEMIGELTKRYGDAVFKELVDRKGRLDDSYLFFINGERSRELQARVSDGDDIVITNMLAGG